MIDFSLDNNNSDDENNNNSNNRVVKRAAMATMRMTFEMKRPTTTITKIVATARIMVTITMIRNHDSNIGEFIRRSKE